MTQNIWVRIVRQGATIVEPLEKHCETVQTKIRAEHRACVQAPGQNTYGRPRLADCLPAPCLEERVGPFEERLVLRAPGPLALLARGLPAQAVKSPKK